MPMPEPRTEEKEANFIVRCMGDEVMVGEYPDEKQRVAVCNIQWREHLTEAGAAHTKAERDMIKNMSGMLQELLREPEGKEEMMNEAKLSESIQLLEAGDPTGKTWQVLLIKPGTSKNGNHYPAETLAKAVPLFESKKAFADHATDAERRARPERSVRDVVGWFDSVRSQAEGLLARFHILESADWLRTMLLDAFTRGRPDLVGFSIDAEGKVSPRDYGGCKVRWVGA